MPNELLHLIISLFRPSPHRSMTPPADLDRRNSLQFQSSATMASFLPTLYETSLLLLSLLFPVRLFSLSLTSPPSGCRTRSLILLLLTLALFFSICAFPDGSEMKVVRVRGEMEAEIEGPEDQILRLGSILEESTRKISVKTELLEEDSRIIESMERDIQYLLDECENMKKSLTRSHFTNNLEHEVQLPKDESQNLKSNILESKHGIISKRYQEKA